MIAAGSGEELPALQAAEHGIPSTALPPLLVIYKSPRGPGRQTDLPVFCSSVPVTQMAAMRWLDVCQERDPIADENVSNCCITRAVCVQRVGWEVRRILQKKGVCVFFLFFLNTQESSRVTGLQREMCVCVCDCMQETRNLLNPLPVRRLP